MAVLRLPSRETSLTIQLLPGEQTALYEYRLIQRRTANWQSFRGAHTVQYHNLSGDEYQFQVRQLRGALLIQRRILIENLLWQRWWFAPSLFLYGLLVMGVVGFLFYRYRIRQFMRMQLIRDRIARDLHDDMGSYLSSISILSAALPADPARAKQNLDRIGQTARQVMDAMSDIVWSINPTQDTMQQVLDRMKQVADELFGSTDTAVVFSVEPGVDALSLPLERRRDFFLIYKEALTNAARYAAASQVQVRLDRQQSLLRLRISDNGHGFDPAHATHRPGGGNGLKNLQVRAGALSGTLSVESAPGQGTRVVLTLPL
ncbi:histidine kinase [Fibrella aestuarina BUZ 2]|uniref:Oxygen sensor histidine kinase NreB n=2 Tax=Fibrella TaxID=861914 RepID=I0KBG0_9BACT|nr:histidine kinase [Fibrella aestuarina BUZ 2]